MREGRRRRGFVRCAWLARRARWGGPAGLVLSALAATGAPAPPDAAPIASLPMAVDSGFLEAKPGAGHPDRVVYADIANVPEAAWVRLHFGQDTHLGGAHALRLTSLLDGHVQELSQAQLEQWGMTSAYFNGEAVLIEVVQQHETRRADGPVRVALERVSFQGRGVPLDRNLCSDDDRRVASNDLRVGRSMPVQCTAWLIEDCARCLLSAGHCASATEVMQFNVPLSNSDGTLAHPPPADQYAVDQTSMQYKSESGGRDWAYFGCFANVNTGLTPGERQGEAFELFVPSTLAPGKDVLRVTGFGVTSPPVMPNLNQAQKTAVGPFIDRFFHVLEYQVDSTPGNSGGPVILESMGMAIGIHTHSGCVTPDLGNGGTSVTNPDLRAALDTPKGVCCSPPRLKFILSEGTPEELAPSGATLNFEVHGAAGAVLVSDSPRLVVDRGAGADVVLDAIEVFEGGYRVHLPPASCGATMTYYVEAETQDGRTFTHPEDAPAQQILATVATAIDVVVDDDFEVESGWAVEDSVELLDGGWERGVPSGGGLRGDPISDYDESGACFLTGNRLGNSDVDGGPTRLVSPVFDVPDVPAATLSYARWFTDNNAETDTDTMLVEYSTDGGTSWRMLEQVSGDQGWALVRFELAQVIELPSSLRLRFSISDVGEVSVLEAAVDRVRVEAATCAEGCVGDVEIDGAVNLGDLVELLYRFGSGVSPGAPADLDHDGMVGLADLKLLLAAFGSVCDI